MVEKNKRTKIFVIGSGGLLGSEMVRVLSRNSDFIVKGARHSELDITKGLEVAIWLERLHPDVIINCAAVSNVDGCETEREKAFAVNAEGVKNICLPLIEDVRAKFIHISTDYVFDGTQSAPYVETDPVHPLSVYAESKLKGEVYARKLQPDSIVLRVQWLYGDHGKSFASQVVRDITQGAYPEIYKLIEDRVGSPTCVTDIAQGVHTMIRENNLTGGIYHLSSKGECSWTDFGKTIFELNHSDLGAKVIESVKEEALKRPAKRPQYTPFNCDRFEKTFGIKLKSWQQQLRESIKRLKGASI